MLFKRGYEETWIPNLYITNTKLRVNKRCLVTFYVDKLIENGMCDVPPIPCTYAGIMKPNMLDAPTLIHLSRKTPNILHLCCYRHTNFEAHELLGASACIFFLWYSWPFPKIDRVKIF